jgi:hypothetical protein
MKRATLLISLCGLLLTSCLSPRKIASNETESATIYEKQSEAISSETYNFADTTKKNAVEVSYLKIEYYPPELDAIPDKSILPDALQSKQGAIKSIEGYTVKATSKKSGISESKENTLTNRSEERSGNISIQTEVNEQPAADPYRWRYVLGISILVVLVGIFAYFKIRKFL